MDIHLSSVAETELAALLPDRARHGAHTLTDDPASADMILLIGSFGLAPASLLDHPLYRAYPEKCVVYTEDDNYLPLVPGVYCSATVDESSVAGRTASFSYVSARGVYSNPYVAQADATKKYLFTFMGGSTSMLRKRLFNLDFKRPDIVIENTSTYYHWDLNQPGREQQQQHYADTLAASHFVLCPRGAGMGSMRLFEVMQAGIAPVLIADGYLLPADIPWDTFLLSFAEKDIARLPELIEPYLASSAERGRLAREAWLKYFSPEKEFDGIVAACAAALQHGPPDEATFRRQQVKIIARAERRRKLRSFARNLILGTLKALHLKSPYQMNER
jgi:hypothetical protein